MVAAQCIHDALVKDETAQLLLLKDTQMAFNTITDEVAPKSAWWRAIKQAAQS